MRHKENIEILRRALKRQGRLCTTEREVLFCAINSMKGSYTLPELCQKAFKRNTVHANTTIDQSMSIFVKAGFVKEIRMPNKRAYETIRQTEEKTT